MYQSMKLVYPSGVNQVKRRQRSTATYVALIQAPGNRLYKNKGPLNVEPKATQFPITFTVKGVLPNVKNAVFLLFY
jgi:hypothetical protein